MNIIWTAIALWVAYILAKTFWILFWRAFCGCWKAEAAAECIEVPQYIDKLQGCWYSQCPKCRRRYISRDDWGKAELS